MRPQSFKEVTGEKRRYIRHPVNNWLLLFNSESIIDMAQIVNICQGGALCASLADACPPDQVEELELYNADGNISVIGVCGKIVHTDYNKISSNSAAEIRCFTFGLQFFQATPTLLRTIEKMSHNM